MQVVGGGVAFRLFYGLKSGQDYRVNRVGEV